MDDLLRISSSSSAAWVAWLLVAMLLLALMNGMFLSDLSALFRGLFSRAERIYIDRNTQSVVRYVTSLLFRVLMIAMALFLWTCHGITVGVLDYLQICLKVLLVLGIQWLLVRGVGAVFVSPKQLAIGLEQRSVIGNAITVLLWPVSLLMMYVGSPFSAVVCCLIAGVFVVIMSIKFIQLFYRGAISLLYMFLYIITLEVLPLVAALLWVKSSL
jgi:hypothetical protein